MVCAWVGCWFLKIAFQEVPQIHMGEDGSLYDGRNKADKFCVDFEEDGWKLIDARGLRWDGAEITDHILVEGRVRV